MNQLNAMKVYKRVVELNGFSAAARELGISTAAVSKNVSDLEAHLGAQLLVRTTRRISVTELGAAYYRSCVEILQTIYEADVTASSNTVIARGRLKINAPMSFGLLHLASHISDFLEKHPEIEVDLVLDDHVIDLIDGGFDVGLRIGDPLQDSTLKVKRLSPIKRVLCGAPKYFEKYGHVEFPTDLHQHRCLRYSLSSSPMTWTFERAGEPQSVKVAGPLTVNNSLALRVALTSGVGLSLVPTFVVGEELKSGDLVTTLPNYRTNPQSLYLVYPQAKFLSQKVRAFIDFISTRFGSSPYWDH